MNSLSQKKKNIKPQKQIPPKCHISPLNFAADLQTTYCNIRLVGNTKCPKQVGNWSLQSALCSSPGRLKITVEFQNAPEALEHSGHSGPGKRVTAYSKNTIGQVGQDYGCEMLAICHLRVIWCFSEINRTGESTTGKLHIHNQSIVISEVRMKIYKIKLRNKVQNLNLTMKAYRIQLYSQSVAMNVAYIGVDIVTLQTFRLFKAFLSYGFSQSD